MTSGEHVKDYCCVFDATLLWNGVNNIWVSGLCYQVGLDDGYQNSVHKMEQNQT